MEDRRITKDEQTCIAECIGTYWGADSENRESETREEQYQSCLTNCKICG
jgi:hypothetical protein